MTAFWQSIRWRIFSYYTLLIAVAVTLMAGAFYISAKENLERLEMTQLQTMGVRLLPLVFPPLALEQGRTLPAPPGRGGRKPRERRWEGLRRAMEKERVFYLAFAGPEMIHKSASAPPELEDPEFSRDKKLMEALNHPDYLLTTIVAPRGKRMLVGKSREEFDLKVWGYLRNIVILATSVFLGTAVFGYVILVRGLRPIQSISSTAQQIAAGDLSGRIEITEQSSELGGLAGVLNQTFDRLEHLLKQQVQFTADASHDLRTPIAAILADCQFSLKKPRTTERYLETIEVCHESAQHMRMLVDQLGLLARYDADESDLSREPLDLAEEVDAVCQVVKPVAEKSGIYLGTDLSPVRMFGDSLRLKQVWLNLLNNALCYTEMGGHVKVRTGENRKMGWLEVADNGIGIPQDALEHVFDRFYRVDDSRNVKTGGSGLGLAICKTIIEAHGGAISVKSEIGLGSCFRVELPTAS
ncbi:MAG: ATP-binding protein [Verrucomicrobiota bacterium]